MTNMKSRLLSLGVLIVLLFIITSGCLQLLYDEVAPDPVIQRAEPYISKIVMNDIELRAYANSIINECKSGSTECQVNAIYRHIVENYNYLSDPVGTELIQTPQETIQIGGGDCEDLSILLNSLLENIGINTYLVLTDTHAYSLACDVNTSQLWDYVEESLISQVEKDWGESIRQTYEKSFALQGYFSWYYGGDGSSMQENIDYLELRYDIQSSQPLHLYVVPSRDDYDKFTQSQTFMQYAGQEEENILSVSDSIIIDRNGGIILDNEGWQDATVTVNIEFYFHPSFYELFKNNTIWSYNLEGTPCVVLDPTAGDYGYPGYDARLEGEKIAINALTKEYTYLG